MLENDGVNALNALANNIKFYCTEERLNSFRNMVEYVGTEDFDTIMKISENTNLSLFCVRSGMIKISENCGRKIIRTIIRMMM